ncbi:MAG: biotin synthase BioB [Candidatus Marinimicrobia bacterium]|nr:biotin synthase BioB [Candidatus Neomarinimicrobiota bacterium]|tara:strand:- start:2744 stop:3730 length:987 start_codon:yes stop_codon:yes gene_type:complete
MSPRSDWTIKEITRIYNTPLMELIQKANQIHMDNHTPGEVQICTLLSIKTGGCTEDCAYCSQAARYSTGLKTESLLSYDKVIKSAKIAKEAGSTRFCMGAAWREVKDNRDFDKVLTMIEGVSKIGLEVCGTLGMATENQISKMKDAGLHAYNHNIDTSEDYYSDIISTHTHQDRMETLKNIRKAGVTVCSGGIIGMGETSNDRIKMLFSLANLKKHPESVPINALVSIEGTPLEERKKVNTWDMVRMISTARITMPKSMVRLSAGRLSMSKEAQALCFLAGANSIFSGEKLLTTPNPSINEDQELFNILGLTPRPSHKNNLKLKNMCR